MPSGETQPRRRLALVLAAGAGVVSIAGAAQAAVSDTGGTGHPGSPSGPAGEPGQVHAMGVSDPVVFTLPHQATTTGPSEPVPPSPFPPTTSPPPPAPTPQPQGGQSGGSQPASHPARAQSQPGQSQPAQSQPAQSQPAPQGADLGTFMVTCYDLRGRTASGAEAGPDSVAVDPSVIPLGTRIFIDGVGYRTADDTGGAIRGHHIDIWESSAAGCQAFGRRYLDVRRAS